MTHRLATNYAKNYCNRTPIVKVIAENVVTCFFGTQCSIGLKRLRLDSFFECLGLGIPMSRSRLRLETLTSWYRLGLGTIRLIYIELQSLTYLYSLEILRLPKYL